MLTYNNELNGSVQQNWCEIRAAHFLHTYISSHMLSSFSHLSLPMFSTNIVKHTPPPTPHRVMLMVKIICFKEPTNHMRGFFAKQMSPCHLFSGSSITKLNWLNCLLMSKVNKSGLLGIFLQVVLALIQTGEKNHVPSFCPDGRARESSALLPDIDAT